MRKSRGICVDIMKSRSMTVEEDNQFCGCVYVLTFLREKRFQLPLLKAIENGFSEWLQTMPRLTPHRGIPSKEFKKYVTIVSRRCNENRSLLLLLNEMGRMNFGDSSLTSIQSYFVKSEEHTELSYYQQNAVKSK